ncbi:cysteine/serine-rich nuclear protein 1 [Tachyglossus aculeatus]|uniref:cysteine/serine-rich nuclear protein 1 n=1 Tax=Tachyglossus aculeatus TaxID=9261 RepID=UPI0018F73469|nr:cysteine/serine-rich nuclear protein 1 [Tachyglossus aculeatus]
MSAVLKRKFDQLEDDAASPSSSSSFCSSGSPGSCSSGWTSDEEAPSGRASPGQEFIPPSILRKGHLQARKRVAFAGVTVFYFPRCQGFTGVPSRGGCTLGMLRRHSSCRCFTLAEFAAEQVRGRRERLRARLKEEKLEALKWKLTLSGMEEGDEADGLTVDDVSDVEVDLSGGELDGGSFLQPNPPRRRRELLRAAGVRKIDREEKRELQSLRRSREDCGCSCQDVCDPETCSCSLAGIKCQMDHTAFPCGCTQDGCRNREGRVEFNQARVQTHFIHTVTRLELERSQWVAGQSDQTPEPPPCPQLPTPMEEEEEEERERAPPEATLPLGLGLDCGAVASQSEESEGPAVRPHLDAGFGRTLPPSGLDGSSPCTPSLAAGELGARASLDLDLADSLDLFQVLAEYGLGPLDHPLRDAELLDGLSALQPPFPGLAPSPGDPGPCVLESLLALAEAGPEAPAPFADSQLLEDALLQASMMEAVQV